MLKVKTILKTDENGTDSVTNTHNNFLDSDETAVVIENIDGDIKSPRYYSYLKNLLDRLTGAFLVIILFPVMLIVAIIIRLETPGNPVFSQERIGRNGGKFIAYKFRTMQANNDDSAYKAYLRQYILNNSPYKTKENGEKIYKLVDDPRITRFGSFLRRSNLDELPQLINIVKGEMSFIGPRPDVPYSVELYNNWHKKRLKVTPGITGLWQVSKRKGLSFDDMVRLDLTYIERQSLFLDIRIFFHTIRTILMGDGS